jgi:CelD/BcsL family acetyltransferase involved in cellulose biosynthesis
VRRAADVGEALDFFSQMRELHLARFSCHEAGTTLAASAVVAFHQRIIRTLFPDGGVEMIRVGSADRAVGFLYNFVVGRKVLVFQTGFEYESTSTWSPGLLTHALAIEHYRVRGMREYDLLAGDALYKRTLCNGERPLCWTTVYRDRTWIRMLLAGRRLRDRFWRTERLAEAA